MEPQRFDEIDSVLAFANSLPEFPDKSLVIDRLETRNVNRYQEAMGVLNELLSGAEGAAGLDENLMANLQVLADRIARLEASDPVGS